MITVHTLGGFEIRAHSPAGPARVGLPPQPSALLVYLALARPLTHRTRDQITALLWPELPGPGARGALNQAVFRLRQALGQEAVARVGDELRLVDIRCDALDYQTALDQGRLEAALDLYGGDLLEAVYLSQSGEFERWIDEERARLRALAVAAARRLAQRDEGDGNLLGATGRLRQALGWSPCEEPVVRDLVRLLVRSGDRTGAVRTYQAYASRLETDLGLPPDNDLAGAVHALLRGGGEPIRPGELARQPHTTTTAGVTPAGPAPEAAGRSVAAGPDAGSTWRRGMTHWTRLGLPAAGLLVVAAAALILFGRKPATAGRVPVVRRIAVSSFANETGDPTKDWLGQLVAERIAEGVSGAGLADVVGDAGRRSARIGVSGSYVRAGDSLVFRARISDAATGAPLIGAIEAGAAVELPETAVELLRQRALGTLALLLDDRFASWARVASRPSSLESYRLYAAGLDRMLDGRSTAEGVGYLLRAAALDSGFTAPLVWALNMTSTAGQFERADSLVRVLEPRRTRLAPWDRAMLDVGIAHLRGNFPEAHAAMRRVVELAPNSEWELELAYWELWTNRPADAIARLGRLDPDQRLRPYAPRRYWFTLLAARHLTGDFEGILDDVARMRRDGVEPGLADGNELAALAALGRHRDVGRLAGARLSTGQRAEGSAVLDAAMEFRVHGFPASADSLLRHLVEWYAGLPQEGWPFADRMRRAVALFADGRLVDARREFERIRAERPEGWTARGYLGQIAAREGDRAGAEKELAWQLAQAGHPLGADAIIHAAAIAADLGDSGRAEHLVQLALTRRFYSNHPNVHRDPRLERLWTIPRARALLRPVG